MHELSANAVGGAGTNELTSSGSLGSTGSIVVWPAKRREDALHHRGRSLRAVATLFEIRDHGVRLCAVETERAECRRVVPRVAVGALCRAGLAGNRQHVHRIRLEQPFAGGRVVEVRRVRHAGIALTVGVGDTSQAVDDRLADLGRHLQLVLVAGGVERLHDCALREICHSRAEVGHQWCVDGLDNRGLEQESAVCNRRVRVGQLQRRRGHQALTDRHLHVVADQQTWRFVLAENVVLHQFGLDRVVGNSPLPFEGQLHAGVGTESEPLEIVLQRRLALQRRIDERIVLVHDPELLTESVEEGVAADCERVGHRHRAVRGRPLGAHVGGILELAANTGGANVLRDRLEHVDALVEIDVVGTDHAAVHRRPCDERLDRRPQVVATLDSAVDQHRFVGVGLLRRRIDLLAEQLIELVAGDVAHPPIVESWIAGHGQDLAIGVVLDDHRTGRCLVLNPFLPAELLRARIHALRAVGDLRIDRVVGGDVLAEDVGGQIAPLQQLGLQRLLGVLLDVEVDRQLNVSAGDRVDVLIDQLADDSARGVDLEDLLAPRAVERVLHRLLDTERADELVGVVVQVLVVLLGLLGDRAEVADHVTRERRVRIHPLPLLDDLNTREVLAALFQVGHGVFIDALFERERQQRAEALALRAPRDGRLAETRLVAAL